MCILKGLIKGFYWAPAPINRPKYIPRLKKSLVSMTQLATSSHKDEFDGVSWKLVKGAMVIARGTRSGTLYTVGSTRKGNEIGMV